MSDENRITVPKLSDDFESGTLVAWHKAVGDSVDKDEVVAEIMTDKVNIEVESPYAGTIKALLVEEEDAVEFDQAIAIIT